MGLTVWDSNKKGGKVTLSNNNLTATTDSYYNNTVLSSNGKNSGKRYFEVGIVCAATVRGVVGIGNSTVDVSTDNFYNDYTKTNNRAVAMYDGAKYPGMLAYGSGFVSGDTVMCKVDFDNGIIEFGKNGTWFGAAFSDLSGFGTAYILLSSASSGAYTTAGTLRTSAGEFAYSIPSGYVAWDTIGLVHRWKLTENAEDTHDGTVSLLHFDNNLTDESGKVWTASGGATTSTTQKKFGSAALYLNGTNMKISTDDHPDFNFGTGDFTIDAQIYLTDDGGWIFSRAYPSNNWCGLYVTSTTVAFCQGTGGGTQYSVTVPSILNAWHHVRVCRKNSNLYIFLDGVLQNSWNAVGFDFTNANITKVGIGDYGHIQQTPFGGYIDEVYINKGRALSTTNFTPPTAPYSPESFGPKLNLTNNGTVTFSSDGASFNGTNQWLTGTYSIPATTSLAIWVKPDSFPSHYEALILAHNGAGATHTGLVANGTGIMQVSTGSNYYQMTGEFNSTNYPTSGHTLCVMTVTGTTLKYYRNTTLVTTQTLTAADSGSTLTIGSDNRGDWFYSGKLADVRIYDYVLSASEISALYAAGPNPSEAGTFIRLAQVF